MAKTIKDMALKAYPIKIVKSCGPLPGGGISEKDDNLIQRLAMEQGANAVLDIIADIVEHRNFVAFPKATHNELINKIKELKGE